MFWELLQRVGPHIHKEDTSFRKSLTPGLKLAITLLYLASWDSYHSLMYAFCVSHSTISLFIPEVCEAIVREYAEDVLAMPTTAEGWKAVAAGFSDKWQFHHALGAIDGKHVRIKCPRNGGSLYHNYKGFHSIILMALVGPNYEFLWVDVGANGSASLMTVNCKKPLETTPLAFPLLIHYQVMTGPWTTSSSVMMPSP